jgi:hypothetical protein
MRHLGRNKKHIPVLAPAAATAAQKVTRRVCQGDDVYMTGICQGAGSEFGGGVGSLVRIPTSRDVFYI